MKKDNAKVDFSARFNALLDEVGVPPKGEGRQIALAKTFGVSQKGARKWVEEESLPELPRAIDICREYNVCIEWFLTGRGPKYPSANPNAIEELTALQRRYQSSRPETKAVIEIALELPISVPLPKSISPTLKTLIDGARMMAAQNLPKA